MNPYDDVPYPSHAFSWTSPDRLATVAAVLGLETVPPSRARVLELGGSSGGNLLPHAMLHPDSSLLGLDLSRIQIEQGQHILADLGVENLRLEVADLATWQPEPGAWDYVICHGVYSWVPAHVREAILATCERALSPRGVAVVSWNSHPGWHMQGIARDAMQFLVDDSLPLAHQAARAQDVMRVLANVSADPESPYGKLLHHISGQLELVPGSYIAHEYLEAHNEPMYLAEFTRHVSEAGLRYLCDTNLSSSMVQLYTTAVQERLRGIVRSQIELEQYLDFLTCRPFHTSLLVRPEAPVQRRLSTFDPAGYWLTREEAVEPDPERPALWDAVLRYLHQAWPHTVAFEEVAASAAETAGVPLDEEARAELGVAVLQGYLADHLDLSRDRHQAVSRAGERPQAWALSRYQAARQHLIANLWHDTLALDSPDLLLLVLSDGTRTIAELAAALDEPLRADPGYAPTGEEDRPGWTLEQVQARLHRLSSRGFYVA